MSPLCQDGVWTRRTCTGIEERAAGAAETENSFYHTTYLWLCKAIWFSVPCSSCQTFSCQTGLWVSPESTRRRGSCSSIPSLHSLSPFLSKMTSAPQHVLTGTTFLKGTLSDKPVLQLCLSSCRARSTVYVVAPFAGGGVGWREFSCAFSGHLS